MGTTIGGRAVGRLALAGLAGALALAGCGGSGASSTASASNQAPSAAASTPAAASSPSLPVPDVGELSAGITAAVKAKGTARVVATSGPGVRSTGAVRYRGSGADISVTSQAAGKKVTMIILRGVAYLNLGEKIRGKSWLRIRPGGADPISKGFAPLLTQLGTSLDLKTQLALTEGSEITDVKRAEVGGTPVTQYTVLADEKALLAQLDKVATTPEMKKKLRAEFAGARSEVVMSIGDDDLPVRVETRVVGGPTPLETTLEYKDWGAPVTIAAPPARDVVDPPA